MYLAFHVERAPGFAKVRPPVAVALPRVYLAVGVAAGNQAVPTLGDRGLQVPAQSEVEGQLRGDREVVLYVEAVGAEDGAALRVDVGIAAGHVAEQERRDAVAAGAVGGLRVALREAAVESEVAVGPAGGVAVRARFGDHAYPSSAGAGPRSSKRRRSACRPGRARRCGWRCIRRSPS